MKTRVATLALAGVLSAAPAAAGEVSAQAALHVRGTSLGNHPRTDVRYDRATDTFELSSYLVASEDSRYGSGFASFSLQGSGLGGDLSWRLALDTGELRRTRFPKVATVCFTEQGVGTGVSDTPPCALLPVGRSLRPVLFAVDETGLASPELTANGRPVADELEATLLVREAYAALSFGRAGFATVRAGRRRLVLADGFVYDDYATGAELALDLGAIGPPLLVTASVFQPTRDLPGDVGAVSPVAALRVDWLPSLFERAGVFAAVHRDRSGSVAELFRGALVEREVGVLRSEPPGTEEYRQANRRLAAILGAPVESEATMAWAGTSGRITPWRGQRLGWTAALSRGRIDSVTAGAGAVSVAHDVDVEGHLLAASWSADVADRVEAGASVLYLSGGRFPSVRNATGTYRGFLGVAPFVTATNLFFGGGLSESFAARQATAPGVNGRGVTAPGLSLSIDPVRSVGIDLKAAWLVAPVKGPSGGRVYGIEADAAIAWALRDGISLAAELDVLWPGDFYAGGRTLHKAVLALDLATP